MSASQESSPWGRSSDPCYLHGVGPGGPESRKSSRDGGTPGRGPQAWAAGPADTRQRTDGSGGPQRGEGEGWTRKGGSRETLGKLSCVQSALLQRHGVTSRQMRPTPYERRGGYRRRGGSGLRGCRTPGLGDSRARPGWAEGLESGGERPSTEGWTWTQRGPAWPTHGETHSRAPGGLPGPAPPTLTSGSGGGGGKSCSHGNHFLV